MNSPDSSAMTDTWGGPPQAGQAAPLHSSRDGVAIAALPASRTGPPATRTQNPSTGSRPGRVLQPRLHQRFPLRHRPPRSGPCRRPPTAPAARCRAPATANGISAAIGATAAARSSRGNRSAARRSSAPAADGAGGRHHRRCRRPDWPGTAAPTPAAPAARPPRHRLRGPPGVAPPAPGGRRSRPDRPGGRDPKVTGRAESVHVTGGAGLTPVLHPEPGRVVEGRPGPGDPAGRHGRQGPREHHGRHVDVDHEAADHEQEGGVVHEAGDLAASRGPAARGTTAADR